MGRNRARKPGVPGLYRMGGRRGIYVEHGLESLLDFHNYAARLDHVYIRAVYGPALGHQTR